MTDRTEPDIENEIAKIIVRANTGVMEALFNDYPDMRGRVHHIDGCATPSPEERKKQLARAVDSHFNKANPLRFLIRHNQHDIDFKSMKTTVPNEYVSSSFPTMSAQRGFIIHSPDLVKILTEDHELGWLEKEDTLHIDENSAYKGLRDLHVFVKYSLEHEFGHTLFRARGYDLNDNEHEIAADVFAGIRHIRKYGADTPMPQELADRRRITFVLGDTKHFSAEAVEDVLGHAHDYATGDMTPDDILDEAVRMAKKYGRSATALRSLRKPFNAIADKYPVTHAEDVVDALGRIFKTATAPDARDEARGLLDIIRRRGVKKPPNLAGALGPG